MANAPFPQTTFFHPIKLKATQRAIMKKQLNTLNPEEDNQNRTNSSNEETRFTTKVVKDGLRNVSSHHIESFDYAI